MRTRPPLVVTLLLPLLLVTVALSCRTPLDPVPAAPPTRPTEVTAVPITVPSTFDGTLIPNDTSSVPRPIQGPTKMAIAPDGRVFIAEHFGEVRIIKNDVVLPTPFVTIPDAVIDHTGSRGLMGIALDPAFASNGYLYVHYTRKISSTVSRNRIARYQATAPGSDVANTTETLLFEMTAQGSSQAHNSMPMLFGADGKLWATTGENNVPANAQNTQHTGGKILRMNADGSPAPGNPMIGSSNEVEKRLWAKGLRNPWTLARDPVSNRIFFNDVGSLEGGTPDVNDQPWEEANFVPLTTTTLLDFGWPNNEGVGANLVHRYANGPGNDGADCAMVGGAFYRSSGMPHSFPASYDGAYFFGDHCSGWIRYLPAGQQTPGAANVASNFATGLGAALLDLQVHPDGSLYYIARATVARDHDAPGIIGRIRPTAIPLPSVAITSPLDGDRAAAPATLSIEATATSSITKVEFFVNGMKVGEDLAAPYQQTVPGLAQGSYRLTAQATNSQGGSKMSDAVTVTVGGPTASIATPAVGSTYIAGQPVSFSGSGQDLDDGDLAADRLEWNVLLHHNSHVHPVAGPLPGASGSFVPNPDDETDHDVHYAVYLTATDSAGLKHTARRDILPIKRTLTLGTSPAGGRLNLDGSPQATPKSVLSCAGVRRNIEAPYYQVAAGEFLRFLSWAHGGPRLQDVFPLVDSQYTANYETLAWSSADIGAVATAGSFQRSGGTFTLRATGADIYGVADEFRFVWQSVTGDASITARVASLTTTHAWTKAVVMMRDGTAAGAVNAAAVLSPTSSNAYRFQVRPTAGASSTSVGTISSALPSYLRLVRTGNSFAAYHSQDNVIFTLIAPPQTVTMPQTVLIGLGLTSHLDSPSPGMATAVFDNVQITGAGPPPPTPPAAPSALTASGGTNQSVLGWTDNASNEAGFKVERKLAAESDTAFAEIATLGVDVRSYVDGPELAAGNYGYRVRAFNAAGFSLYTATASATVVNPSPPAAPSDLVAAGGAGQATLDWVDNASNEVSTKIERKLQSEADSAFVEVGSVGANVRTYVDAGLAANSYVYRVYAVNAAGASARSNAAGAVVTAVVTPAAPSNLFATVANNVITLAWTDNASNETGYRVEKKIGTGAFTTLASKPSNAFSHTDSLSGAGPFAYRVIALGPTESAPSNEAVVSTGNPAADATVRAGTYANTTHGTAATLEGKLNSSISNDRNAYLRFGLTGFSGTVTSAKLRLYGNAATTAKAIGVHAVANTTWVESSITWNTAPAMGTLQQNQTVGLTAGWFEWDITGYVNQQKALGATAISLGLRTTVKLPDGQTTFHSRTGTNRPVLVISSR